MNIGTEWLVDAEGCSAELLRDVDVVRSVCEAVIADLALRVVGEPMWHQFPQPGGVTGLYLLAESHLTCHTFPETRLATFNLYCCRPRPAFAWEERLRALLGASRVIVRTAVRGGEAALTQGPLNVVDYISREPLSVKPSDDLSGDYVLLEECDHASVEVKCPDSTSAREVSRP
ncbi:MAG TPA: S-adenosylmethionine decarboxylase [Blastocatellia bacterium]|nr:S-adenosylmethionine decarboxylase [Blastocatellia bacterium]